MGLNSSRRNLGLKVELLSLRSEMLGDMIAGRCVSSILELSPQSCKVSYHTPGRPLKLNLKLLGRDLSLCLFLCLFLAVVGLCCCA